MSDAYLSGDSHRSNRSTEGKWAVQTYQKKKEQRVGVYHHDSDGGRRERRGNQQPINSRLGLLFILMVCGVAMHVLYQSTSQLPIQQLSGGVQQKLAAWMPGGSFGDEITIQRDPRTKTWGMYITPSLMLRRVDEKAPARTAGLLRFVSRKITHANGVSVLTHDQFRSVESRVGDSITLRFAPSMFVVGATVVVIERVIFESGKGVDVGMTGVVVKIPGDIDGSVASVSTAGIGLWDAFPGQVEPTEDAIKLTPGMAVRARKMIIFQSGKRVPQGAVGVVNKVPGEVIGSVAEVTVGGLKWDATEGQLEIIGSLASDKETPQPPTIATEEVAQLLESLGHQQYLPKLILYGFDKLDFLSQSTKRDGEALNIKPMHWKRIVTEAGKRVPLSGRGRSGLEHLCSDLGEKKLLPKLLKYGLDRLDQVAQAQNVEGQHLGLKPETWKRVVDEARKRVNMTTNAMEQPQTNTHQSLYRLLQDVGLIKHYKRLIVFGLDSVERMANSQNISSTIELQGWEWDRIRTEANNRLQGKAPTIFVSSDPEGEKEQDLIEHETLAKKYDQEDVGKEERTEAHSSTVDTIRGGGQTGGGLSITDRLVGGAVAKEEEGRERFKNVIQRLSNLPLQERTALLQQAEGKSKG